jgi:hypothetical protein
MNIPNVEHACQPQRLVDSPGFNVILLDVFERWPQQPQEAVVLSTARAAPWQQFSVR